jgi:hypothetical protein
MLSSPTFPFKCLFTPVLKYLSYFVSILSHRSRLLRAAVGALSYNPDGSLGISIQNQSPGSNKQSNWLPAPQGPFNLTLRLYWPKPEALNLRWLPPAVQQVD